MRTPLRRYFLTGLAVLLPSVLTIYILGKTFMVIEGMLSGFLQKHMEIYIPGSGVLITLTFIVLVGVLATNLIGKKLIQLGEQILVKIPLFSKIYVAIRQISHAFLGENRSLFRRVVLLEYPRHGVYSLGFVVSEGADEIQAKSSSTRIFNVFVSTTPNPTSGFLVLVPEEETIPLEMSVEEGLKLVISGGTITPTYPKGADKDQNAVIASAAKQSLRSFERSYSSRSQDKFDQYNLRHFVP